MRILFVVNGTDFGGTEVSLGRIAEALRARGHAVHLMSLKPIGPVGRRAQQAGIEVSTLGMGESVGILDLVRWTPALTRWLRQQSFDVIHSFLPRANAMSRMANQLSGARCRHVASERSTDLQRTRSVRLLDRLTARWSETIVTVSAAVRDVVIARGGIAPSKVVVVRTGIDLQAIDGRPAADLRAELQLDASVPLVCTVGRLTPVKGHVFLVRALARIAEPAHLVLVGGGPEEERIRAEAERCGIGPRVHCLGFRADAIPLMKAADVFVLPSLQEGLPVVLLEAMACGRPVVASAVGGVGELVHAGETGMLVPPAARWDANVGPADGPDGVGALSDALSGLLRDRERARVLGKAARRFVEHFHTLEREVDALERLYGVSGQPEKRDQRRSVRVLRA